MPDGSDEGAIMAAGGQSLQLPGAPAHEPRLASGDEFARDGGPLPATGSGAWEATVRGGVGHGPRGVRRVEVEADVGEGAGESWRKAAKARVARAFDRATRTHRAMSLRGVRSGSK